MRVKAQEIETFRLRPIQSSADHKRALQMIDRLWEAQPGTRAGDLLDVLAVLVDRYEEEHFPFEDPDPLEAIRFRMEQLGLARKDLEPLLGSRSRVSEVLSGKRELSLAMIRRLHDQLKIPLEALFA